MPINMGHIAMMMSLFIDKLGYVCVERSQANPLLVTDHGARVSRSGSALSFRWLDQQALRSNRMAQLRQSAVRNIV